MSPGKGDCDIPETYLPILTFDVKREDVPSFYDIMKAAGAYKVSLCAHEGTMLREVPECYMCLYQIIEGKVCNSSSC